MRSGRRRAARSGAAGGVHGSCASLPLAPPLTASQLVAYIFYQKCAELHALMGLAEDVKSRETALRKILKTVQQPQQLLSACGSTTCI